MVKVLFAGLGYVSTSFKLKKAIMNIEQGILNIDLEG